MVTWYNIADGSGRVICLTIIDGITSGTIGTQTSHAHGNPGALGLPDLVFILPCANGVIYQSAVPDATNIYVKGSAVSLAFKANIVWIR